MMSLVAEKMMNHIEYYEYQFDQIIDSEERQNDVHFLYTLKLFYEIGLDRTVNHVEKLQNGIFGTYPPTEPPRKLSTWVYLSTKYYAMHDLPKEAIRFTDFIKIKIMDFLTQDFLNIMPTELNQIYKFGIFYGKNIHLIRQDKSDLFLPEHIYNYMKNSKIFENAFGYGIGEVFPLLEEILQQDILQRIPIDGGEFAGGFGESIGYNFTSLDDRLQNNLFIMINASITFARGFGESIGYNFSRLPKKLQDLIFNEVLPLPDNSQFARGFGKGLGRSFTYLPKEIQEFIFTYANKNFQFAIGLGDGLGYVFTTFSKKFQKELLFIHAKENSELTRGLGIGLGRIFLSLSEDFQKELFTLADRNIRFAYGLGYELGNILAYLPNELQQRIFVNIDMNAEFAFGIALGLGITFIYLPKELQDKYPSTNL